MPDSLPTINKDSLVHLSRLFFFLNFRLYLFASEVHSLTGVSPCHCDQVRVTGHGLSSLIVKFLIFIFFFQAWELFHDITHFLKQHIFLPLFPIVLVTNLVTPITCQHLPNLISGHCQKFFSQNFNFFSLLSNYIWLLNFLFNPSCTTTDQYCHIMYGCFQY